MKVRFSLFLTLKMGIILTVDIGEVEWGNSYEASLLDHRRIYERKYLYECFSNAGNR
jgi:hypothetical protein